MKKIILGLAAIPMLAMLATSCGKETIENKENQGKALVFQPVIGKQTLSRAGTKEVTNTNIQSESLTVHSVWASTDTGGPTLGAAYKDYTLTYAGGAWGYGEKEFHPLYNLAHYSIHPDNAATLTMDEAGASFTYAATGSVDLIFDGAGTTNENGATVKAEMEYKHLLSQVNFAVGGFEDAIIEIRNIELSDVLSTATYTYALDPEVGNWGTRTVPANYTYELAGGVGATTGTVSQVDGKEIVYFGNSTDTQHGGTLLHENALMLMPQNFTASTGAYFEFDYVIYNRDIVDNTNPANPVYGKGSVIRQNAGNQVFFGDFGQNWLAGKRYVYVLNFTAPLSLSFDVIVTDWVDYGGTNGNLNAVDGTHY